MDVTPALLSGKKATIEQRKGRRRTMRRAAVTLGVVVAVLLGVTLLLPFWISTERGRAFVLDQFNRTSAGSITCREWNVSWFTGTTMTEVAILSPEGKSLVTCQKLSTDLTLLGFLRGDYALGNATLEGLSLDVTHQPDGSTDLSQVLTPFLAAHPGWTKTLSGLIDVRDGRAILHATGVEPPIVLDKINLQLPIASPTAPVHATAAGECVLGTQRMGLSFKANLASVTRWGQGFESVVQDMEVSGGQLPTATTATWLNLSPRWDDALGSIITSASFATYHPKLDDPSAMVANLQVRGTSGNLDLNAKVIAGNGAWTVQIPVATGFHASAKLRMAEPIARGLAFVNPLLARAQPRQGTITVDLNSAQVDLQTRATMAISTTSEASARITLDHLVLPREGLLAAVLDTQHITGAAYELNVSPLRVELRDGRISCGKTIFSLPTVAITSDGYTDVRGDVTLQFMLPQRDAGGSVLGGGSVELPIGGTVFDPRIATDAVPVSTMP